jgi:hypothetical protein
LEAGYVLEEDCNREGREIRESGRKFWEERYRSHFDNLFDSIGNLFKAMAEDPLNKRFGEDWARLTRDLLFDSEGSLKFKPELWADIRTVFVPTLVDQVSMLRCSDKHHLTLYCTRFNMFPYHASSTRMTPWTSSLRI